MLDERRSPHVSSCCSWMNYGCMFSCLAMFEYVLRPTSNWNTTLFIVPSLHSTKPRRRAPATSKAAVSIFKSTRPEFFTGSTKAHILLDWPFSHGKRTRDAGHLLFVWMLPLNLGRQATAAFCMLDRGCDCGLLQDACVSSPRRNVREYMYSALFNRALRAKPTF